MGYNAHITRRDDWSDDGDNITAKEWLALVSTDPELRIAPKSQGNGRYFALWSAANPPDGEWLDWEDGQIYTKNPTPALLDKMVNIAIHLDAIVQGDDGEVYELGGVVKQTEVPQAARKSIWDIIKEALFRAKSPAKSAPKYEKPPFREGERVLDHSGRHCTIANIDPTANHGYGRIDVRGDDGTEASYAFFGHGLTALADKE